MPKTEEGHYTSKEMYESGLICIVEHKERMGEVLTAEDAALCLACGLGCYKELVF